MELESRKYCGDETEGITEFYEERDREENLAAEKDRLWRENSELMQYMAREGSGSGVYDPDDVGTFHMKVDKAEISRIRNQMIEEKVKQRCIELGIVNQSNEKMAGGSNSVKDLVGNTLYLGRGKQILNESNMWEGGLRKEILAGGPMIINCISMEHNGLNVHESPTFTHPKASLVELNGLEVNEQNSQKRGQGDSKVSALQPQRGKSTQGRRESLGDITNTVVRTKNSQYRRKGKENEDGRWDPMEMGEGLCSRDGERVEKCTGAAKEGHKRTKGADLIIRGGKLMAGKRRHKYNLYANRSEQPDLKSRSGKSGCLEAGNLSVLFDVEIAMDMAKKLETQNIGKAGVSQPFDD